MVDGPDRYLFACPAAVSVRDMEPVGTPCKHRQEQLIQVQAHKPLWGQVSVSASVHEGEKRPISISYTHTIPGGQVARWFKLCF